MTTIELTKDPPKEVPDPRLVLTHRAVVPLIRRTGVPVVRGYPSSGGNPRGYPSSRVTPRPGVPIVRPGVPLVRGYPSSGVTPRPEDEGSRRPDSWSGQRCSDSWSELVSTPVGGGSNCIVILGRGSSTPVNWVSPSKTPNIHWTGIYTWTEEIFNS